MKARFLLLGAFLLAPTFAEAAPKAAAIELHNLSDEALPRIGEYSENAIYRYFSRNSGVRFVERTRISRLLMERRDRVVLFPGDPLLSAEFGRDLGVDYIVTGNILDYVTDGRAHQMTVEFLVIGVAEEDYILREIYVEEYGEATHYKKHREILDHILETMAIDFEIYVRRAEEERAREAELLRLQEEAEARERAAEAAREKERDRQARAEAWARVKLEEEQQRRGVRKIIRKTPPGERESKVSIRIREVTLLKENWGVGEGAAELQLAALVPRPTGDAAHYYFPDKGTLSADQGDRIPITGLGLSVDLSPTDGAVPVLITAIDSDAPSTLVGVAVGAVLDLVATGAKAIATMRGMRIGPARFLGLSVAAGGNLLSRFLQENDIVGEVQILVDHKGGEYANGRAYSIRSTNDAVQLVFDVHAEL